jgi:hypothetical protein
MSNPGDVILAATLPELSFTATAIPNASAALLATLPALTFSAKRGGAGQRITGRHAAALVFTAQTVTVTDVALAGDFPPLAMVTEARYQSYAVRPVVGQSATRWQHTANHDAGAEDRREGHRAPIRAHTRAVAGGWPSGRRR